MALTAYERRKMSDERKAKLGLQGRKFFIDQKSLDIINRAKNDLQSSLPEGEKATNDMALAVILAFYDLQKYQNKN